MDPKSAWSKIGSTTKTINERVNHGFDALAPYAAPAAARWDREADRRRQLRTPANLKALMVAQREYNQAAAISRTAEAARKTARAETSNPAAAARRAARTAHRAARAQHKAARVDLRNARRNYPATLLRRATEWHTAHSGMAGIASWWMSEQAHHITVWPAALSAVVVGMNAVVIRLGRRTVGPQVDEQMTAEERRLAERLDPAWWSQHAEARGLAGTLPTPAQLTDSGLVSHIRLDEKWTPKTFRAKADEIRALLGARTELRMEIKPGSHGDRATITLRTRSAGDGSDLTGANWKPGAPWGIDTVTGEPVHVPLGIRLLIAGTSGAGKSWSTRSILAEGSKDEEHLLVVIDMKRVEAKLWQHRARVAVTIEEIAQVVAELVEEMNERLDLVPRGQDTIAVSKATPRITVFVDEGAEVMAAAKPKKWQQVMDDLSSLARMGRAACIDLIWATQKPTMGDGIDRQIAAQMVPRICLAVSTATEAATVLGEDAREKGWTAQDLPMPGVAMVRLTPKAKPHHIRTRAMSPQDVIKLPDNRIWERAGGTPTSPLRVVAEPADAVPTAAAEPTDAVPATADSVVLAAVAEAAAPIRQRDITEVTGLAKGTVSKSVTRLVTAGQLTRTADGALVVASPLEASA